MTKICGLFTDSGACGTDCGGCPWATVPVLSKGPTETLHGSCGREKACFISPPQVASTHSPAMTEQVASTKKRKKISEVNLSI